MKDLASLMKYEEIDALKEVYPYESETEKLYFIIKGSVKELFPNPEIEKFSDKFSEYHKLIEEKEEFQKHMEGDDSDSKEILINTFIEEASSFKRSSTIKASKNTISIQEYDNLKQLLEY